jgi:GNAT superfamily N-acetyltransferase
MLDREELQSKLIIRQFRPEDQYESRSLILSGLGEHFERVDPSLNPDLDDIDAVYTAKGHRFVVASIEKRIIGTGGLLIKNANDGRIVRLSVVQDLRGFGFGRAIILYLLELAKNQGLRRIHVETNLDWYPAINLYRQCGFEQLRTDDESIHLVRDLG